jgi:hypothetical protein
MKQVDGCVVLLLLHRDEIVNVKTVEKKNSVRRLSTLLPSNENNEH